MTSCRAAVDRHIAHDRAQRERVEQLKEQELQQERQQLHQWQQQQQHAADGDESDYEDDLAGEEEGHTEAAADGLQDCSLQETMPDHPDYHGRGWRPSTAAEGQHSQPDEELEQRQQLHQQPGSQHSTCLITQAGAEAPELVTLTAAGGSSSKPTSVIDALLSDAAAATGQGHAGSADSNTTTTSGAGACSMWGADSSSAAAAAGSSDQLLTVRSSSSSGSAKATPAAAAAPRAKPAPPAKPPAPVRCRAAPVAVSFTQLSTPHLPAREQREVELRDIKRHAKVRVHVCSVL